MSKVPIPPAIQELEASKQMKRMLALREMGMCTQCGERRIDRNSKWACRKCLGWREVAERRRAGLRVRRYGKEEDWLGMECRDGVPYSHFPAKLYMYKDGEQVTMDVTGKYRAEYILRRATVIEKKRKRGDKGEI